MNLLNPADLYLGVDDHPAPQCEVLRWLAQRLGVPGPQVVTVATLTEASLRGNKRCSNKRLRESGYRFLYPSYKEGYGAMLNNIR
jgi:hypothetical protein